MPTMRHIRLLLITFAIGAGILSLRAQDVSFTTSAPRVVEAGEQFQISFTVNANGSNFQAPDFGNLTVLMGPSTSSSSSIQIINGQMSQTYNLTYTFVVQATKEGNATIGPASVDVKRKTYSTSPVTIEVVKAQAATGLSNTPSGNTQNQAANEKNTDIPSDEIFVRILVDKKEAYQGEPIAVTLKLFSKYTVSGLENLNLPSFNGFFKQDIEIPDLNSLQRENVNGEIYLTGVLRKFVLYPQKSGNLEIDSYTLDVLLQQRVNSRNRSVFDDFFGPSYQTVKKRLVSNQPVIRVKPHPDGKPESFTGAVGNFSIEAKTDKTEAKTDDAISYKITLSGTGNLKLIELTPPAFPADFEVYDPKVNSNFKNTTAGQNGSKSWEYLIIPRHDGQFTLPPLEFSFFDPASGKYKTLRTREYTLNIAKGNNQENTGVVTGVKKEDIQFIGSDIRYIKTLEIPEKEGKPFFKSQAFYLVYLLSSTLFLLSLIVMRHQIKQNADVANMQKRKANKMAIKRLKLASIAMKQNKTTTFYNEIANGLWGYLGHKLGMVTADLTLDNVQTKLSASHIDNPLLAELREVLEHCEFARFAPPQQHSNLEPFYNRALKLITQLDEKIK